MPYPPRRASVGGAAAIGRQTLPDANTGRLFACAPAGETMNCAGIRRDFRASHCGGKPYTGMIMRTYSLVLLALYASLAPAPGWSQERQDLGHLQALVENYLRRESAGLPGSVAFTVRPLDPRLSMPHCPSPEAFLPPGSRLWGRTTVGVRCTAPVPWTVYAAVTVEVHTEYVVSARPLGWGELLSLQDLTVVRGDIARLPAGAIVDPMQAVGKHMGMALAAGQVLRVDMLRAPVVVTQGQGVKLVTQGPGFRVSSEGRALANAAEGQTVPVRAASGQTISGVARSGGIVEVRY